MDDEGDDGHDAAPARREGNTMMRTSPRARNVVVPLPAGYATARGAAHPPAGILSLRSLEKRETNGTLALRDLKLELGSHGFVRFPWPSGGGKSTALHIIAGLSPASAGSIRWHGDAPAAAVDGRALRGAR